MSRLLPVLLKAIFVLFISAPATSAVAQYRRPNQDLEYWTRGGPREGLLGPRERENHFPGDNRISLYGRVGITSSGEFVAGSNGGAFDVTPPLGVGLGFDHIFHENVSVGGRVTFYAMQTDGGDIAEGLGFRALEILVAPTLRLPLLDERLTPYVTLQLGFSVHDSDVTASESEASPGLAYLVAAGIEAFLTSSFAVFSEFGYQDTKFSVNDGFVDIQIDGLRLQAGAKLAI